MLRVFLSASVALAIAGCAHKPGDPPKQQVNHAMKADKYAAPKKAAPVEATTPNEVVKKRWYDRFMKHKST